MSHTPPHAPIWRFFRAGGFDQVNLESAAELLALGQLDQKLWVALACPVVGLEFDAHTLRLIDTDGDGYVRAPELLQAIAWAAGRLTDPDALVQGLPGVPLALLRAEDNLGVAMRQVAQGLVDAGQAPEGVVTVEAAAAAHARHAEQALAAWQAAGTAVCPLGDQTDAAYSAWQAVRDKLQDWFVRCELALYDARAQQALNASQDALNALSPVGLSWDNPALASLPLAQVSTSAVLPLGDGINPVWRARMQMAQTQVLVPLLGSDLSGLTRSQFEQIDAALAGYAAWLGARPDAAAVSEPVAALERLARYVRDLFALANNFVAFRDFYARRGPAMFQAGTLYLDGRSCELCLWVRDAARHAALAGLSGLCLVYLDCSRGVDKQALVAAFTAGDADALRVGRNGVFYDRRGRDWNATITRIVDAPISLRQAFWAPYKRVGRLFAEQLQRLAASQAKSADDQLGAVAQNAATVPKAPKSTAVQTAFDVGKFAGIFAAIGLAIGAIGSALAALVAGVFALKAWQLPLAVLGVMAVISGPSVVLAWFKLRTRQLGPLLDANGWAVNARARINIPFGTTLTRRAVLPPDAQRSLVDPYAEAATPWGWWLFGLAVVLWLLWRAGIWAA